MIKARKIKARIQEIVSEDDGSTLFYTGIRPTNCEIYPDHILFYYIFDENENDEKSTIKREIDPCWVGEFIGLHGVDFDLNEHKTKFYKRYREIRRIYWDKHRKGELRAIESLEYRQLFAYIQSLRWNMFI